MKTNKGIRDRFLGQLLLLLPGLLFANHEHNIGSTTVNFVDPERDNRQISTALYYPTEVGGQNQPIAQGQFPVIVFGHGFVMVHTAYQFLWENLVPRGYIVAFPTTEGSFSPSHLNFGLDLAFLANQFKLEGQNPDSFLFEAVAETSAIMGHSMGGGASFLACANNTAPTTIVTFAAANTNPSSIEAAGNVNIPTLLFAGKNDCVTPPSQHQYPIYDATTSNQKVIIDIIGGGHCFFADYNLLCAIGEGSCSPQPTITRLQQHDITLGLLNPYFDFMLKNDQQAWDDFLGALQNSVSIDYLIEWQALEVISPEQNPDIRIYPNPFSESFFVEIPHNPSYKNLKVFDATGKLVHKEKLVRKNLIKVNTEGWQAGSYFISLISENKFETHNIIKR